MQGLPRTSPLPAPDGGRGKKGEPGQPELPPDSRWRRVKDRERFLTRVTRPRLCLLFDAGVGKHARQRVGMDG